MASKKETGKKEISKKETATPEQSKGPNAVAEFLQGTKEELGKVVWPSRQQLISESFAVILMVTLSATIIYFADALFRWGATQIF